MAGITIEHAQAQLDAWLAASIAIASGQEYEIDTGAGRRKLRRADLNAVQAQIKFWDQQVKELTPSTAGGTTYLQLDHGS
jgi:hypothetical protein